MRRCIGRIALAVPAAALALAWSSPVPAQEFKVGGTVEARFGLLDDGGNGTRQAASFGAAALTFSGRSGDFSATARLVAAGVDFGYAEHRVVWQAAEGLRLIFSASAPELEGVTGFLGILAGDALGAPANLRPYFDYSEHGLFALDVAAGGATFGLAISDTCVPECAHDGAGGFADQERNSLVLSVRGGGPLDWHLYGALSQGSYAATPSKARSSGGGASVQFKREGLRLALDASAASVRCQPDQACTDDLTQRNVGVAAVLGGFALQVARLREQGGAGGPAVRSGVDAAWHFLAGEQVVAGPELSLLRSESGGMRDVDRYVSFAVLLRF
jgi:hypothetical protein